MGQTGSVTRGISQCSAPGLPNIVLIRAKRQLVHLAFPSVLPQDSTLAYSTLTRPNKNWNTWNFPIFCPRTLYSPTLPSYGPNKNSNTWHFLMPCPRTLFSPTRCQQSEQQNNFRPALDINTFADYGVTTNLWPFKRHRMFLISTLAGVHKTIWARHRQHTTCQLHVRAQRSRLLATTGYFFLHFILFLRTFQQRVIFIIYFVPIT